MRLPHRGRADGVRTARRPAHERPVRLPLGGSAFFEGASTALTLLPRSADAQVRTLRTSSGERITERSAVGGR
ncbi:hypothetical protein GTY54_42585 [Streptomyces sp. SID625]|nr:hypothetical protein [Streptomyces sp. SID625]